MKSIIIAMCIGVSTIAQAANGVYPTKIEMLLRPQAKATAASGLQYYGGPVVSNAKVYAVFWGNAVDATVQKDIGGFFAATMNSTYIDWLTEYNTNVKSVDGREGTNQKIGRGTYAGAITITPSHTGASLTNDDIRAELEQQVASQALPTPDENTIFMTYFPAGISITADGATSCQQFCAYHDGFKSEKFGDIYYGVMPDLQSGGCEMGCGFQSNAFDTMTVVSSHELVEAITDPFPTPGNSPAFPQAWNTTDGSEIGDLCASTSTPLQTAGRTYTLQQEWDNSINACAAGPYQSP